MRGRSLGHYTIDPVFGSMSTLTFAASFPDALRLVVAASTDSIDFGRAALRVQFAHIDVAQDFGSTWRSRAPAMLR